MVELEYAKAIYDLAKEENKIEKMNECLILVNESVKNNEFIDLIDSPNLTNSEKKKIITNVYGKLDHLFLDFLYVLIDNNRFKLINEIWSEFSKLIQEEHNILHIEAFSVKPLTKSQLDNLKEALASYYKNKTLEIENIVNPNLIGGIRIECNGQTLDITLKNTLIKMKEML